MWEGESERHMDTGVDAHWGHPRIVVTEAHVVKLTESILNLLNLSAGSNERSNTPQCKNKRRILERHGKTAFVIPFLLPHVRDDKRTVTDRWLQCLASVCCLLTDLYQAAHA